MSQDRRAWLALPFGLLALASMAGCHSAPRVQSSTGRSSYAIGCIADLTGPNDATGADICDAVIVAVQQANESGELPYRLTVRLDDEAAGPQLSTDRLVADEGVIAVIGPMSSTTVSASGASYARANLATVSVTATEPGLAFPTFFRTAADDRAQGRAAARFVASLHPSGRTLVADDGSAFGTGFSAGAEGAGRTVTVRSHAVSAIVAKVQAKSAGAVLYGGGARSAAAVKQALAAIHFAGPFVTDDEARTPAYLHAAGASAEGSYFTCACAQLGHGPAVRAFRAAYRDQTGHAPDGLAASAYDATQAVVDALRAVGRNPSRATVVRAVARVRHAGLTGTVTFTSTHEPANPPVTIYRIQNGAFAYFGPAS